MVKSLPAMQETWVQSLGWENLLEEDMANYNLNILKGKKRESSYFSIFFQKQTPNYRFKLLLNMYLFLSCEQQKAQVKTF